MSSLCLEPRLSVFEGLTSFSRADVDLINLFADVFRTDADWRLWLQEGLGGVLEMPGERVMSVVRTNQLQPSDTQTLSFRKDRISIGREADNDIVISLVGVGRHHAQITTDNKRCFLEDLGSANGTFLSDVKLEPRKATLLSEGAQFTIFPYQFSFSYLQTWRPQEPIQVASGVPRVATWKERRSDDSNGERLFAIRVSPDVGSAVLRISEGLLKALVQRVSHVEPERLVPSDSGVLNFLLLSVLERANHNLKFPFYFSLERFEPPKKEERGISIEHVLDLNGARGRIELFLPDALLTAIRQRRGEYGLSDLPVSWPLLVTIGYAPLSLEELGELEVGDVVLVTSGHRLLLPSTAHGTDRGWDAVLESDSARLRIEGYFERSVLTMESETADSEQANSQKPDLATLPVRVQIVLSQIELSLADLSNLKPGSIIDLNRDKSEGVQLAVNGKIAGAGELVEIEGRLGVRISNWNAQ